MTHTNNGITTTGQTTTRPPVQKFFSWHQERAFDFFFDMAVSSIQLYPKLIVGVESYRTWVLEPGQRFKFTLIDDDWQTHTVDVTVSRQDGYPPEHLRMEYYDRNAPLDGWQPFIMMNYQGLNPTIHTIEPALEMDGHPENQSIDF